MYTSQSYGASLAVWDHVVLPATRHALTPARQADTQFTYPGVDLGGWFTY